MQSPGIATPGTLVVPNPQHSYDRHLRHKPILMLPEFNALHLHNAQAGVGFSILPFARNARRILPAWRVNNAYLADAVAGGRVGRECDRLQHDWHDLAASLRSVRLDASGAPAAASSVLRSLPECSHGQRPDDGHADDD
jgi:hypothetical protein